MLDVINGKESERPPIWIMRQAGRYMKEYRKIREKHDFLSMCLTPDVAAEITLQPIKAFNMDGSIIFSDILIPAVSMGMDLKFIEGQGPVFDNPIRTEKDIENLRGLNDGNEVDKVCEALRLVRNELPDDKTLIGFCGAPFTLGTYMIEGGSSRNFTEIKGMLYDRPELYAKFMDKVTESLIQYLTAQAEAGADVVQIFDTWGGILSPSDFEKFSLPYINKLISGIREKCSQPIIYFMKGNGGFLNILKTLDVDVMGIDWTINLTEAAQRLDNEFVLQGNLDPVLMLMNKEVIKERALEIIKQGKKIKGHIFNLGHGILPPTPVENVKFLVDLVREYR